MQRLFSIERGYWYKVVARDCNEKFLVGFSRLVQGITCAEQIEGWAAYVVVKFAVDMGYKHIILEGDSKRRGSGKEVFLISSIF